MQKLMEGKVIIVTGAGSVGEGWGNGKAAAALYAREGGRVLAVDRSIDAARQTQEIIRGEGGVCEVIAADVSKTADVKAIADAAMDHFGRVDVLVHSAGVPQATPVEDMSLAEWKSVLDANLSSAFLCGREAFRRMKGQGRGRIIFIGSVAARSPRPAAAAYVASKFGLDGLTRAMALEGRDHGVAVSVLHPGFTVTGFGPGGSVCGSFSSGSRQ